MLRVLAGNALGVHGVVGFAVIDEAEFAAFALHEGDDRAGDLLEIPGDRLVLGTLGGGGIEGEDHEGLHVRVHARDGGGQLHEGIGGGTGGIGGACVALSADEGVDLRGALLEV